MSPELLRSLVLDGLLILVSIGLLWKGADVLVESAARIGRRLGLSELVIGLTIVAFGTSAPEFAVTLQAALAGRSDISVGNVVGSNIFNLGFVLGGVALIRGIGTSRSVVWRDASFLIGITLLLRLFINDQHLVRVEGLTMIALLVVYLGILFWQRDGLIELDELAPGQGGWRDGLLLLVGVAVVVGGGHLLVESASSLARAFGVSDWVIGVTIVAAGTSSPELFTSLVAATRGHHGISVGNLIGSDLFNLLGVLGLAAVINPRMVVDPDALASVSVLIVMVVLVWIFLRTGWRLSRLEGALLVGINAVRWVADFTGNGLRLPW
ncbi:MAG: sodium:calcium antiporter [Caldilineae bacterium]|nr:sodium:calcium antiporter [Chloroflexota bacterium]MCB9177627.1 sodium:calcium antiporter [Caldilineae bacterium]